MTDQRDAPPTWAALFERGTGRADPAAIERAVATHRAEPAGSDADALDGAGAAADGADEGADDGADAEPSPTGTVESGRTTTPPGQATVVADTAVLVADLLVDGAARRALDRLREHSWTTLVVSDPLLAAAAAVVAALGDEALARDWRARMTAWATTVEIPPGDHPALAAAVAGDAAHLLTTDERLLGAAAGRRIKRLATVSAKEPAAFARLFDAASLYAAATGEAVDAYPGPDRDPRG